MRIDKVTNTVSFVSIVGFLEMVNKLSSIKVDPESGRRSLRGIKFKGVDGTLYHYRSARHLYSALSSVFGIDIVKNKCTLFGRIFKVAFKSIPDALLSDTATVEEKVSQVVTESVTTEKPSIEDLEKLYDDSDKKGSKDALEKSVQEAYGIDLNKRLTFENMITELQAELEKEANK